MNPLFRTAHRSYAVCGGSILLLCLSGAWMSALAAERFVSPMGKDDASGLRASTAFQTIQHAVDISQPGDTVTVLDGVYREAVKINRSGKADALVTIRSKNRWGAKIIALSAPGNGFTIGGPDAPGIAYITIQGFDLNAPGAFGCGVFSSHRAHHLVVENCYVHQCGSSGLQLNDGDYRTIRNNVCVGNALLMHYCGSGISLYGLIKSDDAPGFHSVISGNVCYGNDNGPQTLLSDGNGIIIDDFRDTQQYHTTKPPTDLRYTGAETLVEGNLVFHNGGRGIHVFLSNNVTLINNTSVENMARQTGHGPDSGEITVAAGAYVRLINNVAVTNSSPEKIPNNNYNTAYLVLSKPGAEYSENVTFQNDLSFDLHKPGATSARADGIPLDFTAAKGNRPGVDPKLLKANDPALLDPKLPPQTDFAAYFGLRADSPAGSAGAKVPGTRSVNQTFVNLGAFSAPSPVRD